MNRFANQSVTLSKIFRSYHAFRKPDHLKTNYGMLDRWNNCNKREIHPFIWFFAKPVAKVATIVGGRLVR